MTTSKRMIGVFSMIFAIGLAAGAQAHAGVTTHKSTLTLVWRAANKGVIGYYIYYGKTPEPAEMQMLPNVPNLAAAAPSVRLDVLRDLGALPGQTVCFRVKAYDRVSESALSAPMCSVI